MSTYTLTRSYRHSLAVRRRRAATARRLRSLQRSLRTLRRPLVARLILSAVISSLATAVVVLSVVAFR